MLKRSSSILAPYTVQIIQLVEVAAPPRRPVFDLEESSSSSYVSSSSECSDSEEEVEESVCSSYCSSEEPELPPETKNNKLPAPIPTSDMYTRMKRIQAWRENFSAHYTTSMKFNDPHLPTSLKRKLQYANDIDSYDARSQTSKRSRSSSSQGEGMESTSSSLGEHSCPACDACFDSKQSLRQHGRDAAGANEACCVAVEYAFE